MQPFEQNATFSIRHPKYGIRLSVEKSTPSNLSVEYCCDVRGVSMNPSIRVTRESSDSQAADERLIIVGNSQ